MSKGSFLCFTRLLCDTWRHRVLITYAEACFPLKRYPFPFVVNEIVRLFCVCVSFCRRAPCQTVNVWTACWRLKKTEGSSARLCYIYRNVCMWREDTLTDIPRQQQLSQDRLFIFTLSLESAWTLPLSSKWRIPIRSPSRAAAWNRTSLSDSFCVMI